MGLKTTRELEVGMRHGPSGQVPSRTHQAPSKHLNPEKEVLYTLAEAQGGFLKFPSGSIFISLFPGFGTWIALWVSV